MRYPQEHPAILMLEDGTTWYGKSAGKIGTTTGEICFNTGMTGYQEIFTDPSYYGQLMVATNVHIGNYGIKNSESQSGNVKIAGLICRNFNTLFSRKMADISLQEFFIQNNVIGISEIDTRGLVNHIRHQGSMNGLISSEITDEDKLKEILSSIPSMKGLELSSKVYTQEAYYHGEPNAKYKVAALDLGIKRNILDNLALRDMYVKVFPGNAPFAELSDWNPDGYFLSNGPGDPGAMPYAEETAKKIVQTDKPIFGICLGHQVLARTFGLSTYKMHNGHRGLNHPVKNLVTGRCEITSQNHGFCVSDESVANNKEIEVTHINLNDNTIEGIRHKTKKIFSVQYHPEASPGPHDANYLFDDFANLLRG